MKGYAQWSLERACVQECDPFCVSMGGRTKVKPTLHLTQLVIDVWLFSRWPTAPPAAAGTGSRGTRRASGSPGQGMISATWTTQRRWTGLLSQWHCSWSSSILTSCILLTVQKSSLYCNILKCLCVDKSILFMWCWEVNLLKQGCFILGRMRPRDQQKSRYNVISKKLSEYTQVIFIFQFDCWMQ